MPAITFNKWDLGIDLRKGRSVSDANRLRDCKNAFITTGLAAQKRPGVTKVATLEPDTKGLFAAFGKLHTFSNTAVAHANTLFQNHAVPYSENGGLLVEDVPFADVFNGFIYTAVQYANGAVQHHYLDGASPSHIADASCPNTRAVIKLTSKLFAVGAGIGDTVRFCATGKPRDWSTANDAGFLPTGMNSRGDRSANALGVYQSKLVVLSRDGAQVWFVDPDPSAHRLEDIVENVGSSFPRSVANVAGDLYFLSDYGFRSITTLQYTNSLADVDIGSPVDPIVQPVSRQPGVVPRSFYYYGTGQYMTAIGNRLFVYSISRSAKIAAWSQYFLPFAVDAFAELGQVLYLRSGDDVYKIDQDASSDDGIFYDVLVDMAYMDFKSPGVLKQIVGVDIVMDGECQFSIGYDERNQDAFTVPVTVKGNTRPGGLIPVECCGTEFALRFRNYTGDPFRIDSITVHYNNLGVV